jgi:DNA-binding transcriptional ArsR family regulator
MVARSAAVKSREGAARAARPARPRAGALAPLANSARTAVADLDRVIHERMRLGIVSALAAHPTLTFGELKTLMRTTDGNLSVHARRLEEADYVTVTKRFEGRVPRTEYRLTERGRRAFERYLAHMEAVIRAARRR